MIIVKFVQKEIITLFGAFNTQEDAMKLLESIPGYYKESVDQCFDLYNIDIAKLPDYMELDYKGKKIPITRFMFDPKEKVEIDLEYIPNMDDDAVGMVDASTRVDAYVISNDQLKDYIEKREQSFKFIEKAFAERGIKATRSFGFSQDGEAITLEYDDGSVRFFAHLDPFFVHDVPDNYEDTKVWLSEIIKNM